ncbi:MAG TPA: glycosyltransferase family 39 protein [Myxococcales bacterium]
MLRLKPRQIGWAIAFAVLAAHLAVAGRYDFFRDELYFIVCGRHPAFGYVDQPPVVPLLAAASQFFGEHLVLLRAIPALAAAGTVLMTCALTTFCGGGALAVGLSGIAAGFTPMFLGLQTTLNTSTFDPLLWTAIVYFVARATSGEPRMWLWAGAMAGLDLEIKYELPLFLLPLFFGLVLAGKWRTLLDRRVALGLGVAVLLSLPSALWQLSHGLPFLEMMRAQAGGKNVALAPAAFIANQVLVMNPLFAPLWLAGFTAPFLLPKLLRLRFAALAFLLFFALLLLLHAKDYYLAPAYASMFASGAVAIEAWLRSLALRTVYVVAALGVSAVAAPVAMPILEPPVLAAYMRALHLAPQATERLRQSELPQDFADMVGWRSYVGTVAAVYRALPAEERTKAAIFTGNYGEAAALDFYGAPFGLPPALSGHNQYFLFGPRGYDGSVLIRVNEEPQKLARRCDSAVLGGRFGAPYAMPYENDAPIAICRGLHPPLGELWPQLKHFY